MPWRWCMDQQGRPLALSPIERQAGISTRRRPLRGPRSMERQFAISPDCERLVGPHCLLPTFQGRYSLGDRAGRSLCAGSVLPCRRRSGTLVQIRTTENLSGQIRQSHTGQLCRDRHHQMGRLAQRSSQFQEHRHSAQQGIVARSPEPGRNYRLHQAHRSTHQG